MKVVNPDLAIDIEKSRLPFPDNSVARIEMDNVLEHIDDLVMVLNECHRLLKHNGVLWIKVPNALGNLNFAFRDPFHKHFFTPESFTKYLAKDEFFVRASPELDGLKKWFVKSIKSTNFIEVELTKQPHHRTRVKLQTIIKRTLAEKCIR